MDNIHDEMQQRNKVRVHWGTLGQASKLEMEACSGPNVPVAFQSIWPGSRDNFRP